MLTCLIGSAPKTLQESQKELRFTRSRQAAHFFVLTAILIASSFSIACAMFSFLEPSVRASYAWLTLLPFFGGLLTLRTGLHCIRHAYIILSPLGIELFPFFKPESNLRVIYWQQITLCEMSDDSLTVHLNEEKSAGVVVSLKPLGKQQIYLLQKAINSRTSSK